MAPTDPVAPPAAATAAPEAPASTVPGVEPLEPDPLAETPEEPAPSDLLPASPLNQDAILEIQTLLNAQGYNTGRPDGLAGRRTQEAIREYQLAQGLTVTGQPSLTLLARLRSQTTP